MLIPLKIAAVLGTAAHLISGCGVKAAPTPILSSPTSALQQESTRRAAETEKEKQDSKKEKKTLEQR
jgi:hypothetical protein